MIHPPVALHTLIIRHLSLIKSGTLVGSRVQGRTLVEGFLDLPSTSLEFSMKPVKSFLLSIKHRISVSSKGNCDWYCGEMPALSMVCVGDVTSDHHF